MFSQPSEIWDFRLRREGILPHLEAAVLQILTENGRIFYHCG